MENLNGWLNVSKEKGITSHDLVYKVRKALKIKKVGHAGTLDPLATGVMVIAVGKATRLIRFLTETKAYKAEIYLGITTSTLDAEGEIIKQTEVNVTEEQVVNIIRKYTGKIKQIPPMASAVHHNGIRLYQLARQGIEVERAARDVEIFSIKLLSFKSPKIEIEVKCQSGTYIRTLADDIGNELACGAHLSKLERIEANEIFDIKHSLIVTEISPEQLLQLDFPLINLPEIRLDKLESARYIQGQYLTLPEINLQEQFIRVYNENNQLLGIGYYENNRLIPKVNL